MRSHTFSFIWINPPDGCWSTLLYTPCIRITFEDKFDAGYIQGEIKFKKTKTLVEVKKILVGCYVERAKKL